jgi:hypothetical protein
MVATFEHPIFGTLFCIVSVFYSFLGGIKIKGWTVDSMRSAARAVKEKTMCFPEDLLVWVLHSISSRIWTVTRNCFLYIECSSCRLIRRPEHLIGRHCGISRQTEGHSFGDHLISESVSVTPSSVIEASVVLCSVSL